MARNESEASTKRPSTAVRILVENRTLIGLERHLLGLVTILSSLAGAAQAVLLLVIARTAATVSGEASVSNGAFGPFGKTNFETTDLLLIGGAIIVVLVIVEIAISFGQASLQSRAQRSVRRRLMQRFGDAEYDSQRTRQRGDQQHVLNSLTSEASAISGHLGNLLVALANFSILTVSAFALSPTAAVTVVGGMIVMLGVLRPVLRLGRSLGDSHMQAARELSSSVIERLETVLEVKAFGVDQAATDSVGSNIDLVALRLRKMRFITRMSSVIYRVGAMTMVLALLALIDAIGATNFAMFTAALLMLLRSLSYGQSAQAAYQLITESLPVVEQLVEEEARLRRRAPDEGAGVVPTQFGTLTMSRVRFAYPDSADTLEGVDLSIVPGDFIALVGPSGSGKSTLMSLLLRLRPPTEGRVHIDGVDLESIDSRWWHRHVAYVPQVSKLQSGTVRDAIRFGREWIDDEDVENAAALAQIADDIERWPSGYDTEVGQLGDQLSGGQRQRVALARALAGRPSLLLLDEPTSSLDPTSERLITESLEKIRQNTTIVTIAHRPATIQNASRVVSVVDGLAVDIGDNGPVLDLSSITV